MSQNTKIILAKAIHEHFSKAEEWFCEKSRCGMTLPFYSSVDIRDAGYKVAPVDTNLYPAGFNNICPVDLKEGPPLWKSALQEIKKLGLITEANSRNKFYLENVLTIRKLIVQAGVECVLTSPEPIEAELLSGEKLVIEKLDEKNGEAWIGNFRPDALLLNNDTSGGVPAVFEKITRTPIFPSYKLGWHTRSKSAHFAYYNDLANEFANLIGVDPWLIQVDSARVGPVDFNEAIGVEKVESKAQKMLDELKQEYSRRGISQKPFIFVKNDQGTYGMGIMVVHDASELKSLNRREKNKMSVGKNRTQITNVIVQEGIPTTTFKDGMTAEPVIYLLGKDLFGGFLRVNPGRGIDDNLNSQGMVFEKYCMSDLKRPMESENLPVFQLVYGSIARLAALALGMELEVITRGQRSDSSEHSFGNRQHTHRATEQSQ